MSDVKFQVGDKVLLIDLSYFKNQYHYKKCIEEYTVLDADEKYWSPYYERYDRYFSGSNQWSIFSQNTGVAIYGGKRFFHKEKDRELIMKMINGAIEEYDNFCKENDAKRKESLQDTIRQCQEEIEQIELGNGEWKSGFSTFNNKEYREKVVATLREKFTF